MHEYGISKFITQANFLFFKPRDGHGLGRIRLVKIQPNPLFKELRKKINSIEPNKHVKYRPIQLLNYQVGWVD